MNTNKNEVAALVGSDKAVSSVVIGYFAKRERAFRKDGDRNVRPETVRSVLAKQKIRMSNSDILGVFKRLQDAGAGKIIIGRHGNPTRLQCIPNLIELAKDIAGTAITQKFDLVHNGPSKVVLRAEKQTNLDTRVTIQYNGCTIIGTKDKVRNIVEHLLDQSA